MIKNITKTLVLLLLFLGGVQAQDYNLAYYFPKDNQFNTQIPTPKEYLGYEIGEWHISHDQLVGYMKRLAEVSDRITIAEYARSYEVRPLVLLTITSPSNQSRIQEIQQEHLDIVANKAKVKNQPVVLYQGYTIHGNEPSGANAAALYAYYLAASESSAVKEYLENAVVLLDPCFNPDGYNRFATWVNQHKNKNLTADPNDREYHEEYPQGRTNHYWFDLNRDWLPIQHPESQGRIRNFHAWYPNVLTDHHEMGTHKTFFYQPGIPSRTNPITPKLNQVLTERIGEFHAEELDQIGSLYYTKESYDDFYYGKGSTYPDVKGSVGILFEQASSRGHLQESENGLLAFPFTVRNQLRTSISTLKAGVSLRKDLLEYQQDFYQQAQKEGQSANAGGYVFENPKDQYSTNEFARLLLQHGIEVNRLSKNTSLGGRDFTKDAAFVVPFDQPQYRLVRTIFEQVTEFPDSLFYDVSAWTLPLAYGVAYDKIGKGSANGQSITTKDLDLSPVNIEKSDYAYILEWEAYQSPAALYAIQKAGVITKLANSDFSYDDGRLRKEFKRGSILIPVGNNQAKDKEVLYQLMLDVSKKYHVNIYGLGTGTTKQVSLGSPEFVRLYRPEVLLLVGHGVTSYDAGEIWHVLDQRYDVPVTMLDVEDLEKVDLKRYTTIIMPNGYYNSLGEGTNLKNWLADGGTLIAMRSAIQWLKREGIANVTYKVRRRSQPKTIAYDRRKNIQGAQVIGGAIFDTEADLTHPLLYGYQEENIPVFHKGTMFLELGQNPYATPLRYTDNPVKSGYISDANLEKLRQSAAITVNSYGSGRVINMVPNPVFRAFWYGTNKIFANAVFFGSKIERGGMNNMPQGE